MPGKPATDQQVSVYMNDRVHRSQRIAAARAGFSERTARRIDGDPRLPSHVVVQTSSDSRRFWAVSVGSSSGDELFPPDLFAVDQGLDRRSDATDFALVRALVVVLAQPLIKIGLQRFDALGHGVIVGVADSA